MKEGVVEVLEKLLDPNDTTVGGGAGSALAGAVAASTIAMVASLSIKRPVLTDVGAYEKIIEECSSLSGSLQEGCVADRDAYCGIVNAFKLPRTSEPEIQIRKKAVQAAAIRAAEVPRDNARMALRVLELGQSLIGKSNPACLSDLEFAVFLAKGAVKDLAFNIEANLPLIRDEAVVKAFNDDMLELLLSVTKK